MSDWQLIDTAPKDGTEILLYRRISETQVLHGPFTAIIESGYWHKGMWLTLADSFGHPTHWMPLPEPPKP